VRFDVFALGQSQGRVAFLPFTKVNRKACAERALPPPVTIGEHIRAKRRERRLRQSDVGNQIGVGAETIANWEKEKAVPQIGFMPAIVRFLGYDPTPEPTTLTDRCGRTGNGSACRSKKRRCEPALTNHLGEVGNRPD